MCSPRVWQHGLELHDRHPRLRRRAPAGRVQVLGPVALIQQYAAVEVFPAAPLEQLIACVRRTKALQEGGEKKTMLE